MHFCLKDRIISDHFYDEWRITLVLTSPSMEWKFPFILYFSNLMASPIMISTLYVMWELVTFHHHVPPSTLILLLVLTPRNYTNTTLVSGGVVIPSCVYSVHFLTSQTSGFSLQNRLRLETFSKYQKVDISYSSHRR